MASISTKKFTPTPDQLEIYRMGKAFGMADEKLILAIKNPETGKPIDKDTFAKNFTEVMDEAAADLYLKSVGVFYQGLNNPDYNIRINTAKLCLQLGCKRVGSNKGKFDLDKTLSPEDQIMSISEAVNQDLITTYKAEQMINAAKTLLEMKIKKAQLEIDKNQSGNGGITINIDSGTAAMLQKAETKKEDEQEDMIEQRVDL